MLDPRDWKPEKPQCIHHNDADSCYACGTGGVSQGFNVLLEHDGTFHIPLYQPKVCKSHNLPNPCWACDILSEVESRHEKERIEEVYRINAINIPLFEAAERARKLKEAIRNAAFAARCWHGNPAIDCSLCRSAAEDYDLKKYRPEINKAMAGIEMFNDLDDLKQLVNFEIWEATRHYGPQMTPALAFAIAKNSIRGFQQRVIEEISILVNIEWDAMPPTFREHAAVLFNEVGTLEKLEALSNNGRADRNRRTLAREIIVQYGLRRSRFESLDEPPFEEKDSDTTSAAEFEFHEKERKAVTAAPDIRDIFEQHREALWALVATWHGDMRAVGEAMLRPGFTVRNVPGVSPSQASRMYQRVAAAFQSRIFKSRK